MLKDQHYFDYAERLLYLSDDERRYLSETQPAEWEDFLAWFSLPEKEEQLLNYLLRKLKESDLPAETANRTLGRKHFCACFERSRSQRLPDYIA